MAGKRRRRRLSLIRPQKLHTALEGRQGRIIRICAAVLLAVIIIAACFYFIRPRVQLEKTQEIQAIREAGLIRIGVMDDIPGFSDNGEGLEIELAELFSEYLMPDAAPGAAIKYIVVSDKTASTKLSDGSIDAVFALMPRNSSSAFSYSYAYYTDECVVAVTEGSTEKPLNEMLIGYVQSSASGNAFFKYVSANQTTAKRSLLDKLLKREVSLPDDAVIFSAKAFASYPDLLEALDKGLIDGAAISRVYLNKYSDTYSFAIHSTEIGTIGYALACSSDSPAIAQLADMFIYELNESGKMDELLIKYGLK